MKANKETITKTVQLINRKFCFALLWIKYILRYKYRYVSDSLLKRRCWSSSIMYEFHFQHGRWTENRCRRTEADRVTAARADSAPSVSESRILLNATELPARLSSFDSSVRPHSAFELSLNRRLNRDKFGGAAAAVSPYLLRPRPRWWSSCPSIPWPATRPTWSCSPWNVLECEECFCYRHAVISLTRTIANARRIWKTDIWKPYATHNRWKSLPINLLNTFTRTQPGKVEPISLGIGQFESSLGCCSTSQRWKTHNGPSALLV